MAAQDGRGEQRRTRSLGERKRIVEEALAPGASVAAVARRHGLNANHVFKWIRRAREGWLDRRRGPAKSKTVASTAASPTSRAFVPVKFLELSTAPASPVEVGAKLAREARRTGRRGAMEISLPNGARVFLDADVDAEALRRVLSARGVA